MGEHYITIPESIYTKYKLTPSVLYGLLNALSLSKGYCWISNVQLAQIFNVDESTIKRQLKILVDDKVIKTEGRNKRKIFILYKGKNEPYDKDMTQKYAFEKGKNKFFDRANSSYNNNKENNKDNIINSQKPSYDLEELMKIK